MTTLRIAAAAALLAGPAAAAQLNPVAYSMINGEGTASGGSFNYWDRGYTGTGAVSGAGPMTSDGELLTGGLGDLTDGVIPTQHWNLVENAAGTGPYVGWNGDSPVITFAFAQDVLITGVTLYYDSAATGGVNAPASFSFGVQGGSAVSSGALGNPAGPTFTTLSVGAAGTLFDLSIISSGTWTFVSEVTFEGEVIGGQGADVPVPAAAPLLLGALGAMGVAARRRRG